jgi:PIN like domain
MADIYGEKRAQLLADEAWLRDAGKNDWSVLTKDDAIRRRPAERGVLAEAAVRVFKPGP